MNSPSDIVEPSTAPRRRRNYGALRQGIEFLVCLGLAVSLCKTFAVETYMIETGSMAPGFYGWHRDVTCPKCRRRFAFGVEIGDGDCEATCPNCGYHDIPVPAIDADKGHSLNVDGDRVLVHKHHYDHRPPRRWEIAMFRNPGRPTENYVKRIVGLPGETIQIRDGDLYAGGVIQRKSLAQQQQIRILVFDNDHRPPATDADWQPRWQSQSAETQWHAEEGAFVIDDSSSAQSAGQDLDWVQYRHWIRDGGLRTTTVPLDEWPADAEPPNPYFSNVTYDEKQKRLTASGAMPVAAREHLAGLSQDFAFQQAVDRLYEKSHIAVITDGYGYNAPTTEQPVRDVMVALHLKHLGGAGEFTLRMTDGIEIVDCRFDFGQGTIELFSSQQTDPIWEHEMPPALRSGTAEIEMSLMDRQCLVSVDGVVVGEPWTYPAPPARPPVPQHPIQFGAAGISARVDSLRLFRDVYYQSKSNEVGFHPYRLGENEYFALGDNSPISEDSRVWLTRSSAKKLTSRHFIGRPFLVHLPSKKWGASISIPDFSRIRYIR